DPSADQIRRLADAHWRRCDRGRDGLWDVVQLVHKQILQHTVSGGKRQLLDALLQTGYLENALCAALDDRLLDDPAYLESLLVCRCEKAAQGRMHAPLDTAFEKMGPKFAGVLKRAARAAVDAGANVRLRVLCLRFIRAAFSYLEIPGVRAECLKYVSILIWHH